MEDEDQPGKKPDEPKDGQPGMERAHAPPRQDPDDSWESPSYSTTSSENEEDPGPGYHKWHRQVAANQALQPAQEASEQKQQYVPHAQPSLRDQYAELTKAKQERDLEKMRKKALKEKQKNKENTDIAHLRARICFEEVEEFKKEACAEYEKAIVDFRVAYDSVVKNAKILVNFKTKAKRTVKNIVDRAKKEMNVSSQVPHEYKIPVPREDINEWSHTQCPVLEADEILKADAWINEGPLAYNRRRQRERELIEGSNKRKNPEEVACKRGNKCWAITRKKFCPYSHKEGVPVEDKKCKDEESETTEEGRAKWKDYQNSE